MVYVVVGAVCGVSGLFTAMLCCGSGKMWSKRDKDLQDKEQLEFCRNFNKSQEKLKKEKENKMKATQNIQKTRKMLRSREDSGQVEFLENWKRQNEKREGRC